MLTGFKKYLTIAIRIFTFMQVMHTKITNRLNLSKTSLMRFFKQVSCRDFQNRFGIYVLRRGKAKPCKNFLAKMTTFQYETVRVVCPCKFVWKMFNCQKLTYFISFDRKLKQTKGIFHSIPCKGNLSSILV